LVFAQLQQQELLKLQIFCLQKRAQRLLPAAPESFWPSTGDMGDGNWPDIQLYRGVCDSSMTALVDELPREWRLSDAVRRRLRGCWRIWMSPLDAA
jgi:hypothetical protein